VLLIECNADGCYRHLLHCDQDSTFDFPPTTSLTTSGRGGSPCYSNTAGSLRWSYKTLDTTTDPDTDTRHRTPRVVRPKKNGTRGEDLATTRDKEAGRTRRGEERRRRWGGGRSAEQALWGCVWCGLVAGRTDTTCVPLTGCTHTPPVCTILYTMYIQPHSLYTRPRNLDTKFRFCCFT